MPESEKHSNLVAMLHSYIVDRFCVGRVGRVITDSISSDSRTRPPPIGGYVPDAYLKLNELGSVVIGEAKTLRDLENSHTEAQVTAFLRRCAMAEGSVLILAVPWPVERLARALLAHFRKKERLPHVKTVVVSEVSWLRTATRSERLTHCRN